MRHRRANFLFVVEILTKHGRGLLLFAAPCIHRVRKKTMTSTPFRIFFGGMSGLSWGMHYKFEGRFFSNFELLTFKDQKCTGSQCHYPDHTPFRKKISGIMSELSL